MRRRMSRNKDRKIFRKTATKTKFINVARPMRGGIRL